LKKETKEQLFFDIFCEVSNIAPQSVLQLKPPYPDILFNFECKKIGVELTELNDTNGKYSRLSHIEAQMNEIKICIERSIKKNYPHGILIFLQFDISKLLTSKEKKKCSDFICNKILDILPFLEKEHIINFDEDILDIELNVWQISLLKPDVLPLLQTEVNLASSAWIPNITTSAINDIVSIKSAKKYELDTVNEFWLLIHICNSWASEFYPVIVGQIDKKKFDKVFILDVSRRLVFEY
jgi:hypothetical protein